MKASMPQSPEEVVARLPLPAMPSASPARPGQGALYSLHAASQASSSSHMLLESLNVSVFSSCMGRGKGSPGWMIWNDHDPKQDPSTFKRIEVVGDITWGVNMSDVEWRGSLNKKLGCQDGCGA